MTDPVATWRMVVAGAIVTGLGLGLGAVALSSDAPQRARPPSSLVAVLPASSVGTSLATVSSASPTEDVRDEVRSVVTRALQAWGIFAGSGDLSDVDGFFDHSGPQWTVFEGEAGSVGTPFTAVLEEESLVIDGQSVIFVADVTFEAEGSEDLSAEWEFELRMALDGRWLIWSVRELAAG